MNTRQWGLTILLVGFLGFTGYTLYVHGLRGFFELATANTATLLLGTDLMIALSLVVVWMWRDARDRGISPLPYIALTLATGSAGPLFYLIRRERAAGFQGTTVAAPAR